MRYRRPHRAQHCREGGTAENQHKQHTSTPEHRTQVTEDQCISSSKTPSKATFTLLRGHQMADQ